jgi:hypothetical protein
MAGQDAVGIPRADDDGGKSVQVLEPPRRGTLARKSLGLVFIVSAAERLRACNHIPAML